MGGGLRVFDVSGPGVEPTGQVPTQDVLRALEVSGDRMLVGYDANPPRL
jgi:hypothetical protein